VRCYTAKAPAAVAPAFTATPSIHQTGDGSVEFEVRLTSCPAPSVQWYKGTTPISDGGRYRAVTHTDGTNYTLTLTITGVTKDDSGAYKVTAKTAAGESNANINLNLEGFYTLLTLRASAVFSTSTVRNHGPPLTSVIPLSIPRTYVISRIHCHKRHHVVVTTYK